MTGTAWAASADARALVVVDTRGDDADVWIDGADGHHLQRVRRLAVDEPIVVADGLGGWYEARVCETRAGAIRVERTGPDRTEPERRPTIAVAFAPARSDHGVEVTHQLVELGVDRIIPLVARRGVVRWEGERAVKPVGRLRRVAREAAMQSHRARVPEVTEPCTVAEVVAGRHGLVVADRTTARLAEVELADVAEWTVLVGPEGGFAPEEREVLAHVACGAVGDHVLRAVTAPVAAAAVLVSRRA